MKLASGLILTFLLAGCSGKADEPAGRAWDPSLAVDTPPPGASTLKLPFILSNGMVLQQNASVCIWGKATPGAKVVVKGSWSQDSVWIKVPADSLWKLALPTPSASFTSHSVSVTDNQGGSKTISDVLIGEVWLSAGQSNMEQCMRGFGSVANGNYQPIDNFEEELKDADIPSFRYFKDKYQLSYTPCFDTKQNTWVKSSPTNALEFQAIAYFFGRKLSHDLNVPIGIIGCAYGGSRIEAWMSPESLQKFPAADWKDAKDLGLGDGVTDKQAPGNIYNGMVLPVMPYTVKGWLWYQGESNRDNYTAYAALQAEMVRDWRELKGDAGNSIPFYFVQLAGFTSSDEFGAARLRAAQMDSYDLIPNCGIVNACDCGSSEVIHYPKKKIPAERLVLWAEAKSYSHIRTDPMAPRFESVQANGSEAIVSVSNAAGLHFTEGVDKVQFAKIAGSDGIWYDADVQIRDGKLVFSSAAVSAPKGVRYCYSSWCVGSIYNADGLPVFPFECSL